MRVASVSYGCMIKFAFSHAKHTKISALDLTTLSHRPCAPCGHDLMLLSPQGTLGNAEENGGRASRAPIDSVRPAR